MNRPAGGAMAPACLLDGSRGVPHFPTGAHGQRRRNDQLAKGRTSLKNVEMKIEANILTITVDLTKEFGPSSSGKTIIIASTEGNVAIPERDEKVGLNVYRKKG
jgi:hypothetical protein